MAPPEDAIAVAVIEVNLVSSQRKDRPFIDAARAVKIELSHGVAQGDERSHRPFVRKIQAAEIDKIVRVGWVGVRETCRDITISIIIAIQKDFAIGSPT